MNAQGARYPDSTDVNALEEMVLSTFLQRETFIAGKPDADSWPGDDEIWTGCISVGGAFSGVITVACTREFVRALTHRLVTNPDGSNIAHLPDEAARDLLAELTNVVGGNLKSLFSFCAEQACQLSLPVIATGNVEVPGAKQVSESWYACEGDRLLVCVYESPAPALRVVRPPQREKHP